MSVQALAQVSARIAAIENRFSPAGGFAPVFAQLQAAAGAGSLAEQSRPEAVFARSGVPAPGSTWSQIPTQPGETPVPAMAPLPPDGGPAPEWAAKLPEAGMPWAALIDQAGRSAGIDPRLLAAVVQQESGFRPDARSGAGAIGLGQLMPATARELGVDPTDPAQNLQGAARYLRAQLDRFGSTEMALAAYNAGPGRVAQAGGVPQIRETQQYVARVLSNYAALR